MADFLRFPPILRFLEEELFTVLAEGDSATSIDSPD